MLNDYKILLKRKMPLVLDRMLNTGTGSAQRIAEKYKISSIKDRQNILHKNLNLFLYYL